MEKTKGKRNPGKAKARSNRIQTNKIIDRITFNPQKHKNKVIKKLRQKVRKDSVSPQPPKTPSVSLKFGSLNINGLDLEASWAVDQLLTTKGFDVSITFSFCLENITNLVTKFRY